MLPTPIAVAACDSICHWAAGSRLRGRTFFYLRLDRKSTRLNSSHLGISYAVFCLKKKTTSSLTLGYLTGTPPHSSTKAASTVKMNAITATGFVASPRRINSYQVEEQHTML